MHLQEQIEMMRRCRSEIVQLRATIAQLQPKAEAYDNMSALIRVAIPQPSRGYGEDLAWMLDKKIAEVEGELTPKAPTEGEE